MLRWLFLSGRAPGHDDHIAWRLSALRIILASGFVLQAVVAFDAFITALLTGTYQALWLVGAVYGLLALGLYYSQNNLRRAAALFIAAVYVAGFLISGMVARFEVAGLGIILLYSTPLIARLFFGTRVALAFMCLNFIPFLFLIRHQRLWTFGGELIDFPATPTHIQSVVFVFLNLCIPLAIFRVLHALDALAARYRQASAELETSYRQYREIFHNAGSALLLTDPNGKILQANQLADSLLGRSGADESGGVLFDYLALENSVQLQAFGTEEGGGKLSAYRNREGKMVALENIAQTASENYIVSLRDVSGLHSIHHALELSRERADYLSSHDHLTNLPNRDMLRKYLVSALEQTEESSVIALVSFRLNSIRHANQKFGAHTGDILLRRFADELARALPQSCFCARLRSIVFSFVLDQARSAGEVITQVERIRQALPKEMEIDGQILLVQFSAGIALARHGESEPDDLIRRSEVALDTARRSSDQAATLFDEGDAVQIRRSVEIEVGIVNGMKQNEFRVVYQPKVNRDGTMTGMEALLRWDSPALGHVSPAEFIPIAESAGLIRGLSNFVLEQTCAQLRRWLDSFGTCPPVAINLSASDIARVDLLQLVDDNCAYYQLDPRFLEFEITETGLIANETLAVYHLNELSERGFGIAIDDFGTGYSSLSKLSHFPARSVKIDRSFVSQIGHNKKSEMIIKAIVSLSGILSCSTVAEGVENAEQERFLRDIGCECYQGYYYYRPMEADDITQLILQDTAQQVLRIA